MHRAVLRQQAHTRQGTASTLTRSEVRGGGRKPYKQKGTGRARQGSIRTPLRPGGGIVFGPKPRSYNLAMNRKERRLALRTALMARIDDVTVVKDFGTSLEAPKTREIVDALGRLGIEADSKVLIVLGTPSEVLRRLRPQPREGEADRSQPTQCLRPAPRQRTGAGRRGSRNHPGGLRR